MLGCLRTRALKQPIILLYFESETVLKFYNLEACVLLSRITDSRMCRWIKNQLTLFVASSTDYHPLHFSLCFMTFYLRYFCMYEINNHNITILFLFSEQRKTKSCHNLRFWQLMLPRKVQRSLCISAVWLEPLLLLYINPFGVWKPLYVYFDN